MLYMDQKRYDKAQNCLQAIASMDPKDVESRKQLLIIYQKLRNDKAEIQVRQELAKLDPKNPANMDSIYKYYDDRKDYKGMQAYFHGLAEQNPDSINLHKYLLQSATKLGDKKAALHELEQLIRLQPKEKKYYRIAADLYEETGNYAEASKKLEAILKSIFKDGKRGCERKEMTTGNGQTEKPENRESRSELAAKTKTSPRGACPPQSRRTPSLRITRSHERA